MGSYLARTRGELAHAHDALVAKMRADRAATGGIDFVDPAESARRHGVLVAYRWLTDPRQTVGPLLDGPASPATVEMTIHAALQIIDRWHGAGPCPDRVGRAVGVLQLLQWALGWTDEPLTVWPQGEEDARAA